MCFPLDNITLVLIGLASLHDGVSEAMKENIGEPMVHQIIQVPRMKQLIEFGFNVGWHLDRAGVH